MPSELFVPKHRTNSPLPVDQTPQRRTSLKKKVLNKVLGSRPSQINVNDLYTSDKSSIRSAFRNGRSSSETIRRPSSEAGRSSSETIRRPNPSQTTLDGSSVSTLELCQMNSNVPYAYPPYPPPSILRVRLSTQAEATHLEVGEEKSIWVAITAMAEATLRYEDVPIMPLNIVIILDNSAYTSADSLKTATRAILDMAAELRHLKDRLAIICTSPAHPWKDSRSGYTLRPLSPIDLTGIQKDLRLATHARPDIAPQNLKMDQTLADAFYLLANGDDMEATGGAYCHVVIVTSNPGSCSSKLGSSAPVPVHILQPTSVPWHYADSPITGHLVADYASGPSIKDKVRDMLLHARARTKQGVVYDFDVNLEPISSKCKIVEIIGRHQFASMAAGQWVNILCKVKVTQNSASTTTSKVDALFAEIESMLGVFNIELLRVTMTYRQSLFPSNTMLTVTNTCSIPVISRTSIWPSKEDNTTAALTTGLQNNVELHKRLVLCMANSATPTQALKNLQSLAPPPIHSGILLSFIAAVKSELSHQIKTITKYNIPISHPHHPPADQTTHLESPTTSPQTSTPTPQPDQRPLSPVAESPDSAKTTIHKRQHSPSEDNNNGDAARKIWKDMKRDSQSTRDLLMMRSVTMGALGMRDGRLQEIQRQAVKNKRSIGADTLRSMSLGTASDEFQGRYAPWA